MDPHPVKPATDMTGSEIANLIDDFPELEDELANVQQESIQDNKGMRYKRKFGEPV